MIYNGVRQFGEALAARRAGQVSAVGADAPFPDVKPEFYADAYGLSNQVHDAWVQLRTTHGPYGLVRPDGTPIVRVGRDGANPGSRWISLESALRSTVKVLFNSTAPDAVECPYVPVLEARVGELEALAPIEGSSHDIDVMRSRTYPGGALASTLIVGLIRRMHDIKQVHGVHADPAELAIASTKTLLDQPLRHPQQWAKPFIFTLGRGYDNSDGILNRNTFFERYQIMRYTQVATDDSGVERVEWRGNHEDYQLMVPVTVADRTRGHETQPGDHQRTYPKGTRLGDIAVTEPTIKCPGFRLAYAMWDTATMVAAQEDMWAEESGA